MSRKLRLSCWVQGDSHGQAFSLKISSTNTVSDLKEAIKKKKAPELNHLPADTLVLWKVNIDMSEDPEGSLARLKLEDGVEGVQKLRPLRPLSKVFPDALEDEHLYIVVERLPTSSSLVSSKLNIVRPVASSKVPVAAILSVRGLELSGGDEINCMALSPDCKLAVSGTLGGSIRVWDSEANRSWVLMEDVGYIHDVAISQDGTCIAFPSKKTVSICKIGAGGFQEQIEHTDTVWCVDFRPDGGAVVFGSNGMGVYDLQTKAYLFREEDVRGINCVAFSPNGKQVASGSADATICVWDVGTGDTKIFSNRDDELCEIAWSPDGLYLASSQYSVVYVWDISTGASRLFWGGSELLCSSLSFSTNGRYLAAGDYKTVGIFDMQTGIKTDGPFLINVHGEEDKDEEEETADEQDIYCLSIQFSFDGSQVTTGHSNGEIKVWTV